MLVEIGNDHAIEGYRADDEDVVRYRALTGERVTTIVIPPQIGLQEAYASVVGALSVHMQVGEKPAWIETDTPGLTALLYEHFALDPVKCVRSPLWGQPKKKTTRRTKAAQTEVADGDEED